MMILHCCFFFVFEPLTSNGWYEMTGYQRLQAVLTTSNHPQCGVSELLTLSTSDQFIYWEYNTNVIGQHHHFRWCCFLPIHSIMISPHPPIIPSPPPPIKTCHYSSIN
jgi:hypothetical protein